MIQQAKRLLEITKEQNATVEILNHGKEKATPGSGSEQTRIRWKTRQGEKRAHN